MVLSHIRKTFKKSRLVRVMQDKKGPKAESGNERSLAGYMIYRNNHPFEDETLYESEEAAKLAVQYSTGHAVIWMKLRQQSGAQIYLSGGHPDSISSEMVDDERLEQTREWLSSLTPEDAAKVPSEDSRFVIAPIYRNL